MIKRSFFICFMACIAFFTCLNSSINEESKYMFQSEEDFKIFLSEFIEPVSNKSRALNKAFWVLETTGNSDLVDIINVLQSDLTELFSDKKIYDKLLTLKQNNLIKDPIMQRQLNLLILEFKQSLCPKKLSNEIIEKETNLIELYGGYRSKLDGKQVTNNELLDLLKIEKDPGKRKEIWESTKSVGDIMAPTILELIRLRNKQANYLGYDNYFDMKLDLNEVNKEWLFNFFDSLEKDSDDEYNSMIKQVEEELSEHFNVSKKELGPWAWLDPYCQGNPLKIQEFDSIFENKDAVDIATNFYKSLGFSVDNVVKNSDLYEKKGKNQHAFCLSVDRGQDVRTLNNIKPSMWWTEVLLHELGHAMYDCHINNDLPWLLRTVPHMIPTEAIALIMQRQVYYPSFYNKVLSLKIDEDLIKKSIKSLKRGQFIFSRFVIMMTHFEHELYKNPEQDLNKLWWDLVKKHQKVSINDCREGKNDWASKYHIGLAPVYYYSYLIGEIFASSLKEKVKTISEDDSLINEDVGKFLKEKLFSPGSVYTWDRLIENVIDKPLHYDAWVKEFSEE